MDLGPIPVKKTEQLAASSGSPPSNGIDADNTTYAATKEDVIKLLGEERYYDDSQTPEDNIIRAIRNGTFPTANPITLTGFNFSVSDGLPLIIPSNVTLKNCNVIRGDVYFSHGELHATQPGTSAHACGPDARAYADIYSANAFASAPGAKSFATVKGAHAFANKKGAVAEANASGANAYSTKDGAVSIASVDGASAIAQAAGAISRATAAGAKASAVKAGAKSEATVSGATAIATKAGTTAIAMAPGAQSEATVPGATAIASADQALSVASNGAKAIADQSGAKANASDRNSTSYANADGATALAGRYANAYATKPKATATTTHDYGAAHSYLCVQAQTGKPQAQYEYAMELMQGLSSGTIKFNIQHAKSGIVGYLEKASKQEFANASHQLGLLCMGNLTYIVKNEKAVVHYLNLAHDQGHLTAAFDQGEWLDKTASVLNGNVDRAYLCYKKALERDPNHAEAKKRVQAYDRKNAPFDLTRFVVTAFGDSTSPPNITLN